jgi:CRISPR-associated protein Cas1
MGTIYITEQGATLTKTDGRLIIRKDDKILQDIPAIHVDQVVVFGNAHFTTPAVHFILENSIDVAYLSSRGRFRARLQPELAKDATLRQEQYKKSLDADFCLAMAKAIVRGKIQNALVFCQRQRKRHEDVRAALDTLRLTLQRLGQADHLDAVRGFEGAATAAFYRAFRRFLRGEWNFHNRLHHPPPDPINAVLSLGYTLLYNQVLGAINLVGLDPYLGFFHQTRHGHATLASDLMEEWRTIIVDSLVLSVVNRGELTTQDFHLHNGHVRLTKEALGRFLQKYDARMQSKVQHARLRQSLPYLRCVEQQVRHCAQVIFEKHQRYHPFAAR